MVASLAIGGVVMQHKRRKVGGAVGEVGGAVPLMYSTTGLEIGKGLKLFLHLARKLTTPDPLPEFTGSMILFVAAFAPHKALVRRFLKLAGEGVQDTEDTEDVAEKREEVGETFGAE